MEGEKGSGGNSAVVKGAVAKVLYKTGLVVKDEGKTLQDDDGTKQEVSGHYFPCILSHSEKSADDTIERKFECSMKGAGTKGACAKGAGKKDNGKSEDNDGADCTNDVGRKGMDLEGEKGSKMKKAESGEKAASGAKSALGGAGVKLEDEYYRIDECRKGVAQKGWEGDQKF